MRKVQQQLPRPCSRRALLRPWPPPPAPLALPAALAPRSKERPGSRFRRICLSSEVNRRKMVDPLGRVSSWKTTRRRAFRSWFSFLQLRRVCAWKRGVWSLRIIVWVGRRTGATCNDQRERMPWREFRVGGMGVCLAYASAYRKQGHGYMLRTPLNIVYSSRSAHAAPRLPVRLGLRAREPGVDRRGRHRASLFGRDCTDPTPRSLATCHRPPLLARSKDDDPMPL